MKAEKNVLGGELRACSYAPLTGYFRDGCCATHDQDGVAHLVCVQVTDEFLEFSVARGNDLVTPRPEMQAALVAKPSTVINGKSEGRVFDAKVRAA